MLSFVISISLMLLITMWLIRSHLQLTNNHLDLDYTVSHKNVPLDIR